jgi:SAM-dependent methyltransferase
MATHASRELLSIGPSIRVCSLIVRESPSAWRSLLSTGRAVPAELAAALRAVPASERDAWVDRVFGLDDVPDDGPELPRGCVPYLPSPVDAVLRLIELAEVREDDVFVDVGSGVGRATLLVHLLTGARTIGLEIQPQLVQRSRDLACRLNAERVAFIEGDAAQLIDDVPMGSVYFFYCPFGGERLDRVIDDLEAVARTKTIRIASLNLPIPSRPWLTPVRSYDDLTVWSSRRASSAATARACSRPGP